MHEFTVFVGSRGVEATRVLDTVERVSSDVYGATRAVALRFSAGDAVGVEIGTSNGTGRLYRCESGFAVVKGVHYSAHGLQPRVPSEELLSRYRERGLIGLEDLEGAYSLVAYDAIRRRFVGATDAAASGNTYYCRATSGMWVTTDPLPLAKALGLTLDPETVRNFLARGGHSSPLCMFRGMYRLGLGERLVLEESWRVEVNWRPYRPLTLRTFEAAADAMASAASNALKRCGAVQGNLVADLSAGYDSRMVVAAALNAGISLSATVNGVGETENRVVAREVAKAAGLELLEFDPSTLPWQPITPDIRRELLYVTRGELAFQAVNFHRLTRPLLAQRFQWHATGGGNDTTRYHPFSHELYNIGRRRFPDLERLLKYRYLQATPPMDAFSMEWYPLFRDELARRVLEICRSGGEGLHNTQYLDAVHILKMTGHFSVWGSAVSGWLPSAPPLASASFVNVSLSIPWYIKLTSHLTRAVFQRLCPEVAAVRTQYGATGAPPTLFTAHKEVVQFFRRSRHLMTKLDRVALGGRLGLAASNAAPVVQVPRPALTDEFLRSFLAPEAMFSGALYNREWLANATRAAVPFQALPSEGLLMRIATLEGICRELDVRPDASLLLESPPSSFVQRSVTC